MAALPMREGWKRAAVPSSRITCIEKPFRPGVARAGHSRSLENGARDRNPRRIVVCGRESLLLSSHAAPASLRLEVIVSGGTVNKVGQEAGSVPDLAGRRHAGHVAGDGPGVALSACCGGMRRPSQDFMGRSVLAGFLG